MEEIQNRKMFSCIYVECEINKKKDAPFENKLLFFILLAFLVCSLLHDRNVKWQLLTKFPVQVHHACAIGNIFMARGATIVLLFLSVRLFWCLFLHAREIERENEREYIFPANNLPATATKYICYCVHPRKHRSLLLRSNSYVHPESQNQTEQLDLRIYIKGCTVEKCWEGRENDIYCTAKASMIIDQRKRNEAVIFSLY